MNVEKKECEGEEWKGGKEHIYAHALYTVMIFTKYKSLFHL